MKLSEYDIIRGEVARYCNLFGYRNASKYMKVSVNSLRRFVAGDQIRPTTLQKIVDALPTFI